MSNIRLPSPPPIPENQTDPVSPHGLTFQIMSPSSKRAPQRPLRRIRPGTKAVDMTEGPPMVPLGEIPSDFQGTEYLKAKYYSLTHPPGSDSAVPLSQETAQELATPPPKISRHVWLYELCRLLCQKTNILILALATTTPACTTKTCREMRASEWQYLCAVHSTPKTCSAMDYSCHTLDWAVNTVTSPSFRARLDHESEVSLSTIFRRLYRIYAHAWFQHIEAFWKIEQTYGLYTFFYTVCLVYDLVPTNHYTIPRDFATAHLEPRKDEDQSVNAMLQHSQVHDNAPPGTDPANIRVITNPTPQSDRPSRSIYTDIPSLKTALDFSGKNSDDHELPTPEAAHWAEAEDGHYSYGPRFSFDKNGAEMIASGITGRINNKNTPFLNNDHISTPNETKDHDNLLKRGIKSNTSRRATEFGSIVRDYHLNNTWDSSTKQRSNTTFPVLPRNTDSSSGSDYEAGSETSSVILLPASGNSSSPVEDVVFPVPPAGRQDSQQNEDATEIAMPYEPTSTLPLALSIPTTLPGFTNSSQPPPLFDAPALSVETGRTSREKSMSPRGEEQIKPTIEAGDIILTPDDDLPEPDFIPPESQLEGRAMSTSSRGAKREKLSPETPSPELGPLNGKEGRFNRHSPGDIDERLLHESGSTIHLPGAVTEQEEDVDRDEPAYQNSNQVELFPNVDGEIEAPAFGSEPEDSSNEVADEPRPRDHHYHQQQSLEREDTLPASSSHEPAQEKGVEDSAEAEVNAEAATEVEANVREAGQDAEEAVKEEGAEGGEDVPSPTEQVEEPEKSASPRPAVEALHEDEDGSENGSEHPAVHLLDGMKQLPPPAPRSASGSASGSKRRKRKSRRK